MNRYLSDALAELLGHKKGHKMKWGAILKGIHAYIKKHRLRDGQTIKPNENMARVFGGGHFKQTDIPRLALRHTRACA